MKKVYHIFSRENGITLALAETLEIAKKLKSAAEKREFEKYLKKSVEKAQEMQITIQRMASSNLLRITGGVEVKYKTLEEYLEHVLNDNKYTDEFELCPHIGECDCTYKTRDSISIKEINLLEELPEEEE